MIQNNGKYLQINSSGMLHPKRVKLFTLLHGFMANMFCAHYCLFAFEVFIFEVNFFKAEHSSNDALHIPRPRCVALCSY